MSERVISTHAITPSVISSPYLSGIFINLFRVQALACPVRHQERKLKLEL